MPVKIRIRGTPLLEEVFTKNKTVRAAVKSKLTPSTSLLRLLGDELVHGYKGGTQLLLSSLKFGPNGGVTVALRGSPYPYGIWRQRQPDGKAYTELSKVTVREKRKNDSPTPNMALLNKHKLVHGLTVKVRGNKSVDVSMISPALNDISNKMEYGISKWTSPILSTNSRVPGSKMRTVSVPPRKHRDIQPAVEAKVQGILIRWLQRFK